MSSPWQLPLGVGPRDDATFDGFYAEASPAAVAALRAQACGKDEPLVFLWGGAESGRSHLLQAACHEATHHGLRSLYLPLAELGHFPPLMLEDVERLDLLAIDDVDRVIGRQRWEEGLFHSFNRMRDAGKRLAIAASASPRQLDIQLPDLASRLAWGATFHLQALTDEQRAEALKLRARERGMQLPDEVVRFILHRGPRRLSALFDALDRLDIASLSTHRRLTIPFVKEALGW